MNNINIFNGVLGIAHNDLLKDFCGIQSVVANTKIDRISIFGNAYNPTLQDFLDGNCSE